MMDLPDDIANETTQYAKLIGMIDYNKDQPHKIKANDLKQSKKRPK